MSIIHNFGNAAFYKIYRLGSCRSLFITAQARGTVVVYKVVTYQQTNHMNLDRSCINNPRFDKHTLLNLSILHGRYLFHVPRLGVLSPFIEYDDVQSRYWQDVHSLYRMYPGPMYAVKHAHAVVKKRQCLRMFSLLGSMTSSLAKPKDETRQNTHDTRDR